MLISGCIMCWTRYWNYYSLTACLLLLKFGQCNIIEGPSNIIYLPGLTPLPIELTCNVIGVAAWRVNGTNYILDELDDGDLPGHSRIGTSILVDSPVKNTEYICVSQTNNGSALSDPAYIIIAEVPEMVPGVTVDGSTININGNNITLALSWGEPFNNFDPIVNYTVLCSGDGACPQNSATIDSNTRSYTITNLTPMTNYTFSVVATNSIGSGEAGVLNYTTIPAIGQVTGVTVFCGPVGLIIQCTIRWNLITDNNILMYQVHYSGITVTVPSSTNTLTFTAPSLPDGVFTGTVVVMVTAVNRFGIGPTSDPATAEIRVSSSVTNTTTKLISSNVTSELYNITVTCTIHPNSTADQCVVMAMADGRVTITGTAPIINGMATVAINGLECEVTYTIIAGGTLNGDLVGPSSSYGTVTAGQCPINMTVGDNEQSDDEFSTGAAVAISVVVTFITTLVVTTLSSVFMTSLYYKYRYELKEKGTVDDDSTKRKDSYGGNITMDTNPAYATTTTIKMDANPAYATASH